MVEFESTSMCRQSCYDTEGCGAYEVGMMKDFGKCILLSNLCVDAEKIGYDRILYVPLPSSTVNNRCTHKPEFWRT